MNSLETTFSIMVVMSKHIHDFRNELNKLILSDTPSDGIRDLIIMGDIPIMIPEIMALQGVTQNRYHTQDVFEHTMSVLDATPPLFYSRLGALFHDIGKPDTKCMGDDGEIHFYGHEKVGAEITKEVLRRLLYQDHVVEKVSLIVRMHMKLKRAGNDGMGISKKTLRKFVRTMGDSLDEALHMMHADSVSHSKYGSMPDQIDNIRERIRTLDIDPRKRLPIPLNGNDIMVDLGIPSGPVVGELLSRLEDAWKDKPTMGYYEALDFVRSEFKRF